MSKRGKHARPAPRWRRAALPAVTVAAATVATFPGVAASARPVPATAEPSESGVQPAPVLIHEFAHPAVRLAPAAYTIRRGDTLSKIAGEFCNSQAKYPDLAANNGIRDANLIITGRHLKLACDAAASVLAAWHRSQRPAHPAYRLVASVAPTGDPNDGHSGYACGDGDGDGFDIPCSRLHGDGNGVSFASSPVRHAYARAQSGGGYQSGGSGLYGAALSSFGRCVIARESGGNSQVMNSSGHYGLYQFSYGTWVAYGGSPSAFGHASAGAQTAVFNNAIAQGGQSNWSPYDGC